MAMRNVSHSRKMRPSSEQLQKMMQDPNDSHFPYIQWKGYGAVCRSFFMYNPYDRMKEADRLGEYRRIWKQCLLLMTKRI